MTLRARATILVVRPAGGAGACHEPRWNLIARVIAPLISQPALSTSGVSTFGVSDLLTSFCQRMNTLG